MWTGASSPQFPSKDPPRACGSPDSHRFLVASVAGPRGSGEAGQGQGAALAECSSPRPCKPASHFPASLLLGHLLWEASRTDPRLRWYPSTPLPPSLPPPGGGTPMPSPEPRRRDALGHCPVSAPSTAGRRPMNTPWVQETQRPPPQPCSDLPSSSPGPLAALSWPRCPGWGRPRWPCGPEPDGRVTANPGGGAQRHRQTDGWAGGQAGCCGL